MTLKHPLRFAALALLAACGDTPATPQPDATSADAALPDAAPEPDASPGALVCGGTPSPVPTEPPMLIECVDAASTLDPSHNFTAISYLFQASTLSVGGDTVFLLAAREVEDGHALPISLFGEFTEPVVGPTSTTFVGTSDDPVGPVELTVCASLDNDGARPATLRAPQGDRTLRCVTQAELDNARGYCERFAFADVAPQDDRPDDWSFLVSFLGDPPESRVDAAMAMVSGVTGVTLVEELSTSPWTYRVDLAMALAPADVRRAILETWCEADVDLQVFANSPLVP